MQLFSRKKALVLSLGALTALGACGDDVTVPVAPDAQVVISITPPNATMNIGEALNFAVQITGGSKTTPPTLTGCSSSNNAVATAAVQTGACSVAAVASGNVTITATASTGGQAAASVTVAPAAAAISNLTTSPTTASISVGQTLTIVPNVSKAAASVVVTYGYATSNSAIATVNATTGAVSAVAPGTATITVTANGSGTGFTTAALTAGVTVTVTAAPPALTGMTVQPTNIDMAVGSTRQISTVVSAAAGITAPTPTYSSNNTAVAGVSAAGLVTAVAPGNAQITVTATSAGTATLAATTLTQLVTVNVSPIANLTIANVRQGPTVTSYDNSINQEGLIVSNNAQVNQPVDIANTRDQIQVTINLQTNGQRVDSVVAYIADANGLNRRSAARQQFTNGNANTSDIEFSINTADFTVNWATGAVDVLYPNGLRIMSASVWTTGPTGVVSEIQNAANNRANLNFNNLDSWAARYIAPSRVAQGGAGSNSNLNWWGGPDVAGQGNWTIAPVFYTPGRTVKTVTTEMSQIGDNGSGLLNNMNGNASIFAICGTKTYTNASTLPWNTTYGYTNLPTNNVNCLGYEQNPSVNGLLDMRDLPTLYNVIDNNNNPGPFMRRLAGYRTSASVVQPAPLRLDYQVTSVAVNTNPQVNGAEVSWANGLYSFVTSTAESDAGVGLPTPLGQTYTWTGCTTGNGGTNVAFDGLVKALGAAGEIPECSNDFLGGLLANGPYRVTAFQPDVLGNIGSGTSPRFGVDKRNPELTLADEQTLGALGAAAGSRMTAAVRVNADSIFDNATTTFSTVAATPSLAAATAINSTNALFGARYRDERAGFRTDNHGTRGLTRWAPAASPLLSNVSVSSQQITSGTRTLNYDGVAGNQESVVDAFDPTFRRDSIAIFGNNGGAAATPGYYFYNITVIDRAGNFSSVNRTAAIDITSPQVTGVTIPAVLQGGSQLTFNPTGSDDLEALDGDLFLQYPTMANGGDGVVDPLNAGQRERPFALPS
ncbi:MAG: Ig-like domain-containing protein [Gemmatimonadaceae bacterium]|nr:Ig-like domain-containing protein [Gemmatimonadaceae bacterium]